MRRLGIVGLKRAMRLDSLRLALEQSTLGGMRRILDSNPAGDNGQRLTLPEEPPEGLRPSYNVPT
jgi:hypothetical protein